MKALLICPSERPQVRALAESAPLVLAPLLGQSLLEYWLSHLAVAKVQEAIVLAHDRPELVHQVVGEGQRWGLRVKLVEESRELSPAQALLKYSAELDPAPGRSQIAVLEHLPGRNASPLFSSYASWFAELRGWMTKALTPDRIGVHEIRPGIWQGMGCEVSPEASLQAPCWLGNHVFVGAGAVVGPQAILEDGTFVEAAAEVAASWVSSDTFVGRFARLNHSLALGNTLVNWETGSITTVPDAFLLCALRRPRAARGVAWLKWLAESCRANEQPTESQWKHLLLNKEG